MQRALIQYRNPKNYYLVREALLKAHREDLIGSGPKCLIRAVPPRPERSTTPPPKLPPKPPTTHRGRTERPAARPAPAAKKGAKTAAPKMKR